MEVTVQLFEQLNEETREAVGPLDGILALEELPQQRTIVAALVITNPEADLNGESFEFWARCLPAGDRSSPREPPELWLRVDFNEPDQKTYRFPVPVVVDVPETGDYEVVIYAVLAEVARVPLKVMLDR
ncbi:MAG: hypothetical protein QF664_09050 [Dehalococcoidia bacterium]|jgi:hypothetical protein|nr:hypothetical protein [Dehalococcoidia bacterium]